MTDVAVFKPAVALRSGGKVAGIVPQTIEEVFRLATAVAKSGLAPKGMTTPEQITVAILHGAELGLPPMQSIQRIAVVNGRPTLWGDAIPALLLGAGFKLREWMDGGTAHCEITRPNGDKAERMFSDADAKTAGLKGKPGPWTQYPDRMKQMRARGFCARDIAADVLGGMYLSEEVEDIDESALRDVTPRRNANQTNKSGDYKRFETACRACTTVDALSACVEDWKPVLATMPETHEALANELVTALRAALDAAPEPTAETMLQMLRLSIDRCESAAELAQIAEDYADEIKAMPDAEKREAVRMLAEAAS